MSPLARVGAWCITAYQLVLSPWVVQQCKYYPSCSAYALEAVRTQGALRGTRLAVWRFLRCNPWSRGGVDHVPGHVGANHDVEPHDPHDHHDATAGHEPAHLLPSGPASSGLLRLSPVERT